MILEEFLNSKLRNSWLYEGPLSVYVRKGIHTIDGQTINTFDIANVSVQLEHQRQGIFKKFISRVENSTELPIFIENILDAWLVTFFKRRGYIVFYVGGLACAIKKDNNELV